MHLLGPSRRRHWRSHTLTGTPSATQLCRWSLDPQDLCRLQFDRRITNCLGSATKSTCSKFDRRGPRKAKYTRLPRFGLEIDVPILCCGRVSPSGRRPTPSLLHSLLHGSSWPLRLRRQQPSSGRQRHQRRGAYLDGLHRRPAWSAEHASPDAVPRRIQRLRLLAFQRPHNHLVLSVALAGFHRILQFLCRRVLCAVSGAHRRGLRHPAVCCCECVYTSR